MNWKLDVGEWASIARGALVAGGGAAAAYFLHTISGMEWGDHTPLVAAVAAVVLNYLRKIITIPNH